MPDHELWPNPTQEYIERDGLGVDAMLYTDCKHGCRTIFSRDR
jgi:hypothetical protein